MRRTLELTQEQFAAHLQVAASSIRNWESGRKRPAPRYLRKMAELAPAFGAEIARIVEKYEWHPKRLENPGREEITGLAELLPEGLWDEINDRAKKQRKPLARVCADLLESGLHAEVEEMAEKLHADRAASTRRRKQAS